MASKKILILNALAAAAMLGATGCGSSSSSSSSSSKPGPSPKTGYITISSCGAYGGFSCYCDSYYCYYDPSIIVITDSSGGTSSGSSTGSSGGTSTGSSGGDVYSSSGGTSSGSSTGSSGSAGSTGSSGSSGSSGGDYYSSGSCSSGGSNPCDAFSAGGDYVDQAIANANFATPAQILSGESVEAGGARNAYNAQAGADDSANLANSVGGETKDVDLQKAQLEQQDMQDRAQNLASTLQMNYDSALQITQLADKVQTMTAQGEMTLQDRDEILDSTLSVAKISKDDINNAITSMVKDHNETAMDDLMTKAAANLGMPSSAGLRDQVLPALGIKF